MTHEPPGGLRLAVLTGALMALGAVSAMTIAAVSPALPEMRRHFADVPDADLLVRLVLSVPTLAIALFGPVSGALADRFGRRPLLLGCITVYVLAGTVAYWLDDLSAILVSRALLGLGMAGMFTLTVAVLGDLYSGAMRNRVLAWNGALHALGGVTFVFAGGLLAELDWRAPFLIYALPVIFVAPILLYLREFSTAHDAASPGEADTRHASFPVLLLIYAMIAVIGGVFLQMPLNLPFLLVEIGRPDPRLAGLAIAWAMGVMALAATQFPRLRARLRPEFVFVWICSGLAIGYLLLSRADSLTGVAVALVAFGIGMGPMYANSSTWLMAITPARMRARVIGGLTMAIYTGQFASPLLSQPVVRSMGLQESFAAIAALLAAMAMATGGVTGLRLVLARRADGPA